MATIEYSVLLRRSEGNPRPDVCIFFDEDREKAIKAMRDYRMKEGLSVQDKDGRYSIRDIVLVEKERIVGAPVLSETPYCKLFDAEGKRL